MSKSNIAENEALSMFLNGVNPSYGGNIYLALHVSDPGEDGNQNTSEVSLTDYPTYSRVAIPRDNTGVSGFTTSGNPRSNIAQVQFPTCVGGNAIQITHFSLGELANGAGKIIYSGSLSAGGILVANNTTPLIAPGALLISED